MERALRITLDRDLPLRARPLSPDALANVFGGCLGTNGICSIIETTHGPRQYYACCPGLICRQPAQYDPFWVARCRPA
jgi:hypothetical protein